MEMNDPSSTESVPQKEEHFLHLKIGKNEMRWITIVLVALLAIVIIVLAYCLDRSEELLRHSPEHYFASFSEIGALDDMDVNIAAYFKENGKKQVTVFDKTDKITYCYELSNYHGKIVVDRSYCRSDDLPQYKPILP